jgi:sugar lactone lactonase YvrE
MGIAGADDGFFARFSNPQGITVGAPPNFLVYVADTDNGRLRRIVLDGEVTSLLDAGGGKVVFGKGSDGSMKFSNPGGVAVDGAGNIYVSDTGANCIRKITGAK